MVHIAQSRCEFLRYVLARLALEHAAFAALERDRRSPPIARLLLVDRALAIAAAPRAVLRGLAFLARCSRISHPSALVGEPPGDSLGKRADRLR